MNEIISTSSIVFFPVEQMGEVERLRFLEFFTANIFNPNTRKAYMRASVDFMNWRAERSVTAKLNNHLIASNQTILSKYIV